MARRLKPDGAHAWRRRRRISRRAGPAATPDGARHRRFFEQAPLPLAIFEGPRREVTLANRTFADMFGDRPLVGRPAREALPELDEAGVLDAMDRVFEQGQVHVRRECPLIVERGGRREERYFGVVLSPIRAPGGDVEAVLCSGVDITDEVLARRELQKAARIVADRESWLASLLDFLPIAVVLFEAETGDLWFSNRAAEQLLDALGVRAAEPGSSCRVSNKRLAHLLDRVTHEQRLRGVEIVLGQPPGAHTLLVNAHPLPATHGHPATVAVTLDDITQLKEMQRKLEQAVRMREDFLSIAAHELRTPLAALKLNLSSTQRATSRGEPIAADWLRARLDRSLDQIARLERLIERLLDAARIAEGRLRLDVEPMDLAALARAVVDSFRDVAGAPELRLRAPGPVEGVWDRLRLEQVVTNLVSNAIKYGGGQPVDVVVEAIGPRASLRVMDRGPGIPKEDQVRIFDRFERASTRGKPGGLGLGLWITRSIVEAMGGKIIVDSEQGRGSTFTVELPRAHEGTGPRTGPQPGGGA